MILKKLTKEEYHILKEKGTELPFTGKYYKFKKKGVYYSKACKNKLFDSKMKYDSNCGWPSFFEANKDSVKLILMKPEEMVDIDTPYDWNKAEEKIKIALTKETK